MNLDFSWEKSAENYITLYEKKKKLEFFKKKMKKPSSSKT